jgi:hypothetical protein
MVIGFGQEIDVKAARRTIANGMLHDGYRQECVAILGRFSH